MGIRYGIRYVSDTVLERARKVKLLVLDVDGVLTDGRIIVGSDGVQVKSFDVRDGFGLVLARKAGVKTALITAERSKTVTYRASQLRIDWVAQFARDKAKAFGRCCQHFKIRPEGICYMGDDLLDLPVLRQVGLSVSVPEAPPEVKRHVDYVTKAPGGRGAVREVIELILQAQGHWAKIVQGYLK